jgi:hypothetical protein
MTYPLVLHCMAEIVPYSHKLHTMPPCVIEPCSHLREQVVALAMRVPSLVPEQGNRQALVEDLLHGASDLILGVDLGCDHALKCVSCQ